MLVLVVWPLSIQSDIPVFRVAHTHEAPGSEGERELPLLPASEIGPRPVADGRSARSTRTKFNKKIPPGILFGFPPLPRGSRDSTAGDILSFVSSKEQQKASGRREYSLEKKIHEPRAPFPTAGTVCGSAPRPLPPHSRHCAKCPGVRRVCCWRTSWWSG